MYSYNRVEISFEGMAENEAMTYRGKYHKMVVQALFENLPEIRSRPSSIQLELVYSPCPYEQLELIERPFEDEIVAHLNDEMIRIEPDFDKFVKRTKPKSQCGKLGMMFIL